MTGRFGWLASYPKSGNTWVRMMLEVVVTQNFSVDINSLRLQAHAANRLEFDELLGVESSDLSVNQIQEALPAFYKALAANAAVPLLLRKTHERFGPLSGNSDVFSENSSVGAVYLTRDPRDVAVSYAYHRGTNLDWIIGFMAADNAELASNRDAFNLQLPQPLGSWSSHVESWLNQAQMPLLQIRYEDLLECPASLLGQIAAFFGIKATPELLEAAVQATSFERLRAQEAAHGFVERGIKATRPFFREGKASGWKNILSGNQADLIVRDHGRAMARLGYL